ncbi:MAG: hypothetical protein U0935_02230 [Pirellulales bacterium]
MSATLRPTTARSFPCPPEYLDQVVEPVRSALVSQGFTCQRLNTDDGVIVLRIEKRARWRKLTGLATGLTVEFLHDGQQLQVEIREPQWGDKALVVTIGTFVALWPLAITGSVGAYQQMKLPQWVLALVEDRIAALRAQPQHVLG